MRFLLFLCFLAFAAPLYALPGSSVVLLWRADCPPCLREVPHLVRLAETTPSLYWRLIALGAQAPVLPPAITVTKPASPDAALFDHYGDTRHILPYSAFLRADGSLCGGHYGLLSDAQIQAWRAAC